jgi:hypothetical protein
MWWLIAVWGGSCTPYRNCNIKIINRDDGLIKSRNVKLCLGSVYQIYVLSDGYLLVLYIFSATGWVTLRDVLQDCRLCTQHSCFVRCGIRFVIKNCFVLYAIGINFYMLLCPWTRTEFVVESSGIILKQNFPAPPLFFVTHFVVFTLSVIAIKSPYSPLGFHQDTMASFKSRNQSHSICSPFQSEFSRVRSSASSFKLSSRFLKAIQ